MAGALREILAFFGFELDTKELDQGHDKVEGFIGTLSNLGHVVAEAFVFHEVKEFVEGIVDAGSELEHMATRTGFAIGELQELQYAAKQADVDAGLLDSSLTKLAKNLVEARDKGGEAAKAFQGIDLKDADGNLRAAGDVLPDIADKIRDTENVSERAALAIKYFGKSGAELIPFLVDGSEGLAKMAAEARELGGGLSEDAVEAAGQMEHETKALEFAFTGLKSEIASEVLPYLTELVHGAVNLVRYFREWSKHTKFLQAAFLGLGSAGVLKLLGHIGGLRGGLGLLRKAFFEVLVPIYALEDFLVFMAGGKSAIGYVLEKAFGKGTSDKVREGINGVLDSLMGFGKTLTEFLGSDNGIKTLELAFAGLAAVKFAEIVSGIGSVGGALGSGSPFGVALAAAIVSIGLLVSQWQKLQELMKGGSDFQQNINAKREAGIPDSQIKELQPEEHGFLDSIPFLKGIRDKFGPGADIAKAHDAFEKAHLPAVPSGPAALPIAASGGATVIVHDNKKIQTNVTVPPGTPGQDAQRVSDAATRGTLRGTDLGATHAALVPGAG